ncbi:MAG TPA: hypothetical protein VFN30_10335 [Chitinophagaceae bacterium]|nr:hypothetical protein [Chitinophagaceae bacterium]
MNHFDEILSVGDLRSIGQSNKVVSLINNQNNFDELFQQLFHQDRKVVMRAADAIEKITLKNPVYLKKHKDKILLLCNKAKDKELKWHLALIIPRLSLNKKEFGWAWQILTNWVKDKKESRIVRVNSLQALFVLLPQNKELMQDFNLTIEEIANENIPSLNARIKKLKNDHR